MKFVIGSLVFTLASSVATAVAPTTEAPILKRLSCVSSNGTTLETIARRAGKLVLQTRLGLFEKEFTAALALDKDTQKTTIELTDENARRVSYLLDLTIDLKTRKEQTRYGSIVRTGDGYVAPSVVATALCDLVVR